jgi:hypothetical protein
VEMPGAVIVQVSDLSLIGLSTVSTDRTV